MVYPRLFSQSARCPKQHIEHWPSVDAGDGNPILASLRAVETVDNVKYILVNRDMRYIVSIMQLHCKFIIIYIPICLCLFIQKYENTKRLRLSSGPFSTPKP